jgi:hypothetical protein
MARPGIIRACAVSGSTTGCRRSPSARARRWSGIAGARLVVLPGRGHATALYHPRAKPSIESFLAEPAR